MADELSNRIRFYYFISAVLSNQQNDPWCGICKAFANGVTDIRESVEDFRRLYADEIETLPGGLADLLSHAGKVLAELEPPADAVGQKKAGNCKMPEGVCLVKVPKAIREEIS